MYTILGPENTNSLYNHEARRTFKLAIVVSCDEINARGVQADVDTNIK